MSIAATTVNVKIAIEKAAIALLLATALVFTCLLMAGTGADLPMLLPLSACRQRCNIAGAHA